MPIQDLAASPIENDSTADSSDVCFLHTSPPSSGTVMHYYYGISPYHRCHCMKCSEVNCNTGNRSEHRLMIKINKGTQLTSLLINIILITQPNVVHSLLTGVVPFHSPR